MGGGTGKKELSPPLKRKTFERENAQIRVLRRKMPTGTTFLSVWKGHPKWKRKKHGERGSRRKNVMRSRRASGEGRRPGK